MPRLLALLVAVAGVAVLAGIFVPSQAASVGSGGASRQTLDSDLSAIAQSPNDTCFLSEERELDGERPLGLLGAGTPSPLGGVYDVTFVDDWLGSMITERPAEEIAQRRDLVVTAADMVTARAVLERRISRVLSTYARGITLVLRPSRPPATDLVSARADAAPLTAASR